MIKSRRQFIHRVAVLGGGLTLQKALPAWARSGPANGVAGLAPLSGCTFDLSVSRATSTVEGEPGHSILINGHLPAPLLRWKEGAAISLRVTNHLTVDTSIHWHGILLPFQMDGVPGVSFPGIRPGETFTYRFPVRQAGTYWYHSHSGLQEQLGHYGPIIIEPQGTDSVAFDREYVIVLSDWTFEDPHRVFARLKKMSDAYNFQQRTVGDFFAEADREGMYRTLSERMMWGGMRMNPTDIADVTGATYTYLINGHGPSDNWTGLFNPGERVRLRFINAAAMSIFNVRIPGLPMTVVQADGLNVQPVEIDEFQIGVAETYDVITHPKAHRAYALIAESNDRSGYARATLSGQVGAKSSVPDLRPRPTLSMKDMAMDHGSHRAIASPSKMNHAKMGHSQTTNAGLSQTASGLEADSSGMSQAHNHKKGVGVIGLAMNPVSRLGERPNGLQNVAHRVLVYSDLRSLEPNPDTRDPQREIELHLTGNMERYMWSFDGMKFSEVEDSIIFYQNERVRLTLVNDTMMLHPIHLHGMFFDLVTGDRNHKPRKHTIVVKPGEKLSVDITADAPGDWAFHCHLLYHMHAGMIRVVSILERELPA